MKNKSELKKYRIEAFPSPLGTPVYTNYYILAVIIAIFRMLGKSTGEVRVINNKTKKHIIVW